MLHRVHQFFTLAAVLMTASVVLAQPKLPPFEPAAAPPAPDYSQPANWMALPQGGPIHPVDIFWVYPTVLHDNANWLMGTNNEEAVKAAQGTLIKQASVFSGQANLHAPYYRQMNMAALALSEQERNRLMDYGKEDVWRAFNHYLSHHNNGRPFILAGHSQGSDILLELARKHWGTLGIEKNMVAAYLIGWSITGGDLKANPALSMCGDATQINCFISYNTMLDGRQGVAPTVLQGAVVVNPLSWEINDREVPASRNLGARIFEEDGTVLQLPHFTSARVKDYGLVVKPKDASLLDAMNPGFPKGVYHVFDYSLFYENLRKNVADRIGAFLGN